MNNTLFVMGNLNLKTVELVARSLKERYPEGFASIVIFESPEIEKDELRQVDIYRRYFDNNFTKEAVLLEADGSISSQKLFDAFSRHENITLDLSNGQKSTTSMLYTAAVLCNIADIYHLRLLGAPKAEMKDGIDYQYLKMPLMDGFEMLSSIGNFDLIYYMKAFRDIFRDGHEMRSHHMSTLREGLQNGISGYFSGKNGQNASIIQDVTRGNELLRDDILGYIFFDRVCKAFCHKYGISKEKRDPIGVLSHFFRTYAQYGHKVSELNALCPVPGLLSALRDYRNIAAHNSVNNVNLTEDDARAVINMELTALRCLKRNQILWNSML